MKSVYLETTVIGNIAGRLHPDPMIATRQIATRDWWFSASDRYELFASALVVDECSSGDSEAAAERLAKLDGIPLIGSSPEAETLVDALLDGNAVPNLNLATQHISRLRLRMGLTIWPHRTSSIYLIRRRYA